jgi:hypothetical protein
MTAPALVLATALSAAGGAQPANPAPQFKPSTPLFYVPPLQQPDQNQQEPRYPAPEQPLVCTRTPVIPGDNSIDPKFVQEIPKDVLYAIRRAPVTVRACPKEGAGKQ